MRIRAHLAAHRRAQKGAPHPWRGRRHSRDGVRGDRPVSRLRMPPLRVRAAGQSAPVAGGRCSAALAGIGLPVEPRRVRVRGRLPHALQGCRGWSIRPDVRVDPSQGESISAACRTGRDRPARATSRSTTACSTKSCGRCWRIECPQWHRKQWKLASALAGHYDYNTLDQNAVIVPASDIAELPFREGFSGHGPAGNRPLPDRAVCEDNARANSCRSICVRCLASTLSRPTAGEGETDVI